MTLNLFYYLTILYLTNINILAKTNNTEVMSNDNNNIIHDRYQNNIIDLLGENIENTEYFKCYKLGQFVPN